MKLRALDGERDKLSRRELEFVGVGVTPPLEHGWRSPAGLYVDEVDTEVDPMLQALALLGQSRLGVFRLDVPPSAAQNPRA